MTETGAKTDCPGVDAQLEAVLRSRLRDLKPGTTLCPSEIARAVGADHWRSLMEPTRGVARRLVAEGTAEVTQHGDVVDPATARGPIRIRPAQRPREESGVGGDAGRAAQRAWPRQG